MHLPFSSKRLGGGAALGALALVLAGCNPGTAISSKFLGSNINPNDQLAVRINCAQYVNDTSNNCSGTVTGLVDGKYLVATTARGEMQDVIVSPDGSHRIQDCTTATPCTHSGYFDVGNSTYSALWGTQRAQWELYGYDFDPAQDGVTLNAGVTLPDTVTLGLRTLGSFSTYRTFTCSNSCLEITNRPAKST